MISLYMMEILHVWSFLILLYFSSPLLYQNLFDKSFNSSTWLASMQLIRIWTSLRLTLVFMMAMEVGILPLCFHSIVFSHPCSFSKTAKRWFFSFMLFKFIILDWNLIIGTCKPLISNFISLLRKLGGLSVWYCL